MIPLEQIESHLVAEEGEVLHAYQDHLGFWTIGVGRLIDKRRGGGITREESRYLLRNDIARKAADLRARFPWFHFLDDARQSAILCMAFQLGINGIANFKKMALALTRHDYETAAAEALDSGWAKQTPARAKRMAEVIRTGVWK